MVLSETSKPSMSNSPWMRGAPQVGFSATMRKISPRTSLRVGLLPGCLVILETSLQYRRKPARCQRTTVSGVTMRRDCFQPDQTRRATTQKTRSKLLRLGRGRRRFRTESCWRRAKFSRRKLRCERKRRTIVPKKSLTNRSMASSYTRTAGETPATRLLISLSAGVWRTTRYALRTRPQGQVPPENRPKRFLSTAGQRSERATSVALPLSRLRFGELVFAGPGAIYFRRGLEHRLELAAAHHAAVVAVASGKFVRAFDGDLFAFDRHLTLESPPVAAFVAVDIVVIAALRAFAVANVRHSPICDRRVIPQRVSRLLRAVY